MSYRELTLQPSYYTTTSDIAKEFYNPVLSNTVSYDRVSGYFSSQALASYAKGLEGLINNNGHMRLIISIDISESDFNLIKEGYVLRRELKESLINQIDLPLSKIEQVNFFNLANLIANGYVDIKIGFTKTGIFHSKFGLCQDFEGEIIYFTGSNNETQAAISHNFESFDITTTWLASPFDQQKILKARDEFERLWNAHHSDHIIYVKEIDELIKNEIIKYDKGRVILDTETLTTDALILTIQDEKLVIIDNLESYVIKPTDFFITQRMAPYFYPGYPDFSDDLTYVEMKKVIDIFNKYSQRKKFKFIVSSRLEKYLEEKAYFIEERSKYGILLKGQDEKVLERFKKFKEIVTKELSRTLRDKQMWSAFYMQQMKNASNFSVPGAGKTSMIYGVFAYLNSPEINKVDKIVMIGPKNSFLSWKLEFEENFGDKKRLKVLDIHETQHNHFHIRMDSGEKNLILINYESLQKYESVLSDIIDQRTMLVFDEGHKIKGIQSKRAQSAKRVSVNAGYKYVLTGTPIPNNYQDIYNFLNILYSDEYNMFFNFKPNDLLNPNPSKVEEINDKMYPFFWRTTKQELDVPPANEDEIIQVNANSEEQAIIDLLYLKYGDNPFNLYIRLMQAASNPELLLKSIDAIEMYGEEESQKWLPFVNDKTIVFTEEEVSIIKQVSVTTKYKAAIDLARQLYKEGKQSIIWCMFVNTIDKAYTDLRLKGMNPAVIYGSTPQEERDSIIANFKAGKIDVLITNPHTLAESVSLHKTCHDAIYLEYSFNLTHMLQSRDRIHRLGLPEGQYTQYYYFMLNGQEDRWNTIDEKIYIRLKEKEERMMKAIEKGILEPDPTEDYQEILDLFKM
ncbi:SNF2-related protein [Bacillus sp. FJAT-27986]|uniref:SNF2-related protein n=1 Tax=Bacillus sp. FJAT-27986 TaxID=1743146 RepID=UPI00080AE26E|nr:SNF2-related protein [Bacillus sp. FJAT-27986]OCA86151.1 helicase SNF2 [Bacillus sp. FJAT-27986]